MDSDQRRGHARLVEAFRAAGEVHAGHSADPVDLDGEDRIWLVERGAADLFVIESDDGRIVAPLKQLLRAETGDCLFGAAPAQTGSLCIRAKLAADTVLLSARRGAWMAAVEDLLADRIDTWLDGLGLSMALDVVDPPRTDRLLHPGESLDVADRTVLSSAKGITWVKMSGQAVFVDAPHLDSEAAPLLPLSPRTWVRALGDCRAESHSSRDLMRRGRLFDALVDFHRMFLDTERLGRMLAAVDSANLQRERTAVRRRQAERADAELSRTVNPDQSPAQDAESALLGALEAIGTQDGIQFKLPRMDEYRRGEARAPSSLTDILTASNVRARQVRLSSQRRWWQGDGGSLLAFRAEDGAPVALIPGRFGGYRMVGDRNPPTKVNARLANSLRDEAWAFQLPLPRQASARDLARLAMRGAGLDMLRFFAAGLAAAALALAPAFAIRALVERGLPAQDPGIIVGAVTALALLAVGGIALSLYQTGALLRTDGRMAARVTAAIWDRVMRVPTGRLRQFSAGDLGQRAFALQGLRGEVSGVLANALLSAVFLAPAMAVTYAFNATIGGLSLVLGLASLGAMTAVGLLQVDPTRQAHLARQSLAGVLYEFINGIAKLRSTGAEESVFAFWAHRYSRQKRAEIEQQRWSEWLRSMAASLPIFASTLIFATAAYIDSNVSVADFVAAYSAALVVFTTITRLATAIESLAVAVPTGQQAQPLLAAQPEPVQSGGQVTLKGEVRFDRVSFHYPDAAGPVLEDISIHAQPGEFIGIVGESGSGKSTLLRLALALEAPTSGSLYYDSHDVTLLNRRALRKQIGVVFQDAPLQPGTVLQNIIGVATDLTVDDAWRAAKLAAVERDIRKMPMEMHTGVVTGSSFFSGGQIQRIQLAAALVRNPRIVLLDEATNWLDTANQAAVMDSIAALAATRIVIAHRLSTIRTADRIYVLQGGRVAQSGTFQELLDTDGPFRRLARRQMVGTDSG